MSYNIGPHPRLRIPPIRRRRDYSPCGCGETEPDAIDECGCRKGSLEEAQMCEGWGSRNCPLP